MPDYEYRKPEVRRFSCLAKEAKPALDLADQIAAVNLGSNLCKLLELARCDGVLCWWINTEAMGDGSFRVRQIRYWGDVYLLTGFTAVELEEDPAHFFERVDPKERATLARWFGDLVQRAQTNGEAEGGVEFLFKEKAGSIARFEAFGKAQRAVDDLRCVNVIGITRDVTIDSIAAHARAFLRELHKNPLPPSRLQAAVWQIGHTLASELARFVPFTHKVVCTVNESGSFEFKKVWIDERYRDTGALVLDALEQCRQRCGGRFQILVERCPFFGEIYSTGSGIAWAYPIAHCSECLLPTLGLRVLGINLGATLGYRSCYTVLLTRSDEVLSPRQYWLLSKLASEYRTLNHLLESMVESLSKIEELDSLARQRQKAVEIARRLQGAEGPTDLFFITFDLLRQLVKPPLVLLVMANEMEKYDVYGPWELSDSQKEELFAAIVGHLRSPEGKEIALASYFHVPCPEACEVPSPSHWISAEAFNLGATSDGRSLGWLIIPGLCGQRTSNIRLELETVLQELGSAVRRVVAVRLAQHAELARILDTLPLGGVLLRRDGHVVRANRLSQSLFEAIDPQVLLRGKILNWAGEGLVAWIEKGQVDRWLSWRLPGTHSVELRWALVQLPELRAGASYLLLIEDATEEAAARRREELSQQFTALGRLAAGLAHRMNNTLASIVGYAELWCRNKQQPDESKKAWAEILQQAEQAGQVVKSFLGIAGRGLEEVYPFDAHPIISETLKFLSTLLPSAVKFEAHIEQAPLLIKASPGRVQGILMAIASAAQQFLRAGSVMRWQASPTRSRDEGLALMGGEQVMLRIVCDCKGLDLREEEAESLCNLSPTMDRRLRTSIEALGEVMQTVQGLGGICTIRSTAPSELVVTVLLPVFTARGEEATLPPQPKGEESKKERLTILFVEDDRVVRTAYSRLLERGGVEVIQAENGKEALKLLESMAGQVDLVLTDWVMPELGGREFIMQLRKRWPELPIVVLTAYPLGEESQIPSAHVDAWLCKPVKGQELEETILRVVRSR